MVRLPVRRSNESEQAFPVLELGTQSNNSNREGVKNQLSFMQVCESRVFSLKCIMSGINYGETHKFS